MKKKKVLKRIAVTVLGLALLWSVVVLTDYIRAKNLKPPLFSVSMSLNQYGEGYYKGIGYTVIPYTAEFTRDEPILYDMHFMMFGRGYSRKRTLNNGVGTGVGFLGLQRECLLEFIEALCFAEPENDGEREIYTQYLHQSDMEEVAVTLRNGIVSEVRCEYRDIDAAYEYMTRVCQDLRLTYGDWAATENIDDESALPFEKASGVDNMKINCDYYAQYTPHFEGYIAENIKKMTGGNQISHVDIRVDMRVVAENYASVYLRYVEIP